MQWDVQTLNKRRLAWGQQTPQTRDSGRGGMASAKTLVAHEGKRIEEVGWCWEHAAQRPLIAHDELISHYGCPSGAHYPSEWRRFKKRAACPPKEGKDHTELCIELSDDAGKRAMPGDCPVASSFTSAPGLKPIQRQQRAYVGDLKLHRQVV